MNIETVLNLALHSYTNSIKNSWSYEIKVGPLNNQFKKECSNCFLCRYIERFTTQSILIPRTSAYDDKRMSNTSSIQNIKYYQSNAVYADQGSTLNRIFKSLNISEASYGLIKIYHKMLY